jgi:hypothetical protein
MDERDFNHEIARAWQLLKETLHIGRTLIWGRSLPIDEVFRDVALSSDSSYDQIFKVGLSRSSYNVLLDDYAFFQFNWFDDTSWRLGFFPNPYLTGVAAAEPQLRNWELLEEIGALNHEEVSELIAEMPYAGAVPPVRFEYAPTQYRELMHPAAHFHIGRHDENRWSSSVWIGPKAFVLIIAKLYYPVAWAQCSTFYGAQVRDCIEDMLLSAMANVRSVHLLSDREKGSFQFGKHLIVQNHV